MSSEHISVESPFSSELSVDGEERVTEFLNRHGAPRLMLSMSRMTAWENPRGPKFMQPMDTGCDANGRSSAPSAR